MEQIFWTSFTKIHASWRNCGVADLDLIGSEEVKRLTVEEAALPFAGKLITFYILLTWLS